MQTPLFKRLAQLSPERLQLLQQLQNKSSQAAVENYQPHHLQRDGAFPLSLSQLRIWRLMKRNPGAALHQLCADVELRGNLDPRLFARALELVVQAHPALRTQIFEPTLAGGNLEHRPLDQPLRSASGDDRSEQSANSNQLNEGVLQRVVPHAHVASQLKVLDPPFAGDRMSEADYTSCLREWVSEPIDLEHGLPWRAILARLEDDYWRFSLIIHHVVCDGYALGLVQREISQVYDRLAAGEELDSVPPSGTLAVHIEQERTWLTTEDGWKCRDLWQRYWKAQAFIPELQLPRDYASSCSRGDARSGQAYEPQYGPAAVIRKRLEASDLIWFEQRSREWSVTPAAIVLATWKILLSKLLHESVICLGVPFANRDWPGGWEHVGMFVNTLPLVSDISDEKSFADIVQAVSRTLFEAAAHGKLPLEEILRQAETDQRPAIAACLSNLFVWQSAWELGHTRSYHATAIDVGCIAWTDADLVLNVAPVDGGLDLLLVYRADCFVSSRMTGCLDQFETILKSGLQSPQDAVGDISGINEKERNRIFGNSIGSQRPQPADRSIVDKIRKAALCNGDILAIEMAYSSTSQGKASPKIRQLDAIESEDQVAITYSELLAKVESAARSLCSRGIDSEDVVGVLLPRSPELILSMVSILFARGAFLVLDPSNPQERLHELIAFSNAKLVVTLPSLIPSVEEVTPAITWHSLVRNGDVRSDTITGIASPEAEEIAYLICTSGSTGVPKLVEVQHAGMSNHSEFVIHACSLGRGSRVSHTLASSFDASLEEIFPTLAAGGTLVIHPDPRELAIPQLLEFVNVYRIEVLHIIATLFPHFAAFLASGDSSAKDCEHLLRTLRILTTGGDVIMSHSARDWMASAARGVRLQYIYGVTEASVTTTVCEVTQQDIRADRLPIGRPIQEHAVWILDRQGRLLPLGAVGEIWIGGVGVAKGYRGSQEATNEKFRDVSLPGIGRQRLYRSGDRGRWRSDGQLEFLGRIDEQAKVRGWRVEPGEVQAAIQGLPEIADVRVLVRHHPKQIVAFVVFHPDCSPETNRIREKLRQKLPIHLIPSAILSLEKLPRLANGKVDDKYLLSLQVAANSANGDRPFVALPQELTSTQCALWRIWDELLESPITGIDDDFFALGGDSILVMQVVHQSRQAGWDISPSLVFQNPTIRQLAEVAKPIWPVATPTFEIPMQATLGPAQQMFFAWDQPNPGYFHQAVMLVVPIAWTEAVVQSAWTHVRRRHPVLSSRFEKLSLDRADSWRQVYGRGQVDSPCFWFHASPEECNAQFSASETQAVGAMVRYFERIDPFAGPISIAVWYPSPPGQASRLLLAAHHLVVDGVSWRILLDELEIACQQLATGAEVSLGNTTTPFAQWTERLAAKRATSAYTPMPSGTILPQSLEVGRCRSIDAKLDRKETAKLLTSANIPYRTHAEELILAALVSAAATLVQADSIPIDIERHGRNPWDDALDVSRTVGWFTEVVPIECALPMRSEPLDFVSLITTAKETLRSGLRIATLKRRSDKDLSDVSTFSPLSFNYLGQLRSKQDRGFAIQPLPLEILSAPENRRSHPFEVLGYCLDGELHVRFSFASDLLAHNAAQDFVRSMFVALKGILEHCQREDVGALTASDVDGKTPTEIELRALNNLPHRDIAHVFPLTSVQQIMLLHSLSHPNDPAFREQLEVRIEGPIDFAFLRKAWQELLRSHGILRTHFIWQGLNEPRQVTRHAVELPWSEADLSSDPVDVQELRWEAMKSDELSRMMDLSAAPLLRIAVARRSQTDTAMSLVCHHALLDGWSLPLLFEKLMATYENLVRGEGKEIRSDAATEFRHFVQWLEKQETTKAEAWFKKELSGLTPRSSTMAQIRGESREGPSVSFSERSVLLEKCWLDTIDQGARRFRISLGSMMLAAWAYVVATVAEQDDLTIGVTISGRPVEYPGIVEMLGPLAHPLPIRFRWDESSGWLEAFLQRVHQRMADLGEFSFVTMSDVVRWCPPYGSLPQLAGFVFENYPMRRVGDFETIRIHEFRGTISTTVPLLLAVFPTKTATARLRFSNAWCTEIGAGQLISLWREVLEAWSRDVWPESILTNGQSNVVLESPRCWRNSRSDRAELGGILTCPADGAARTENYADARRQTYKAPTTWIESQLVAIWQDVLGVDSIGIHDKFPELGGTSLQAIQLLDSIEKVFGRRLPLMALYAEPTIQEHARLIGSDDGSRGSEATCLVPLRSGEAGIPLFCVHPAGGTVFCYAELARHLEVGRPVWGLQARGVAGIGKPAESVEEMAGTYVHEIVKAWPCGPYAICGWSSGGIIAFEVARQLALAGRTLAQIILFDTAIRTDGREYTSDDMVSMLTLMFPDLPVEQLMSLEAQEESEIIAFFRERALQAGLISRDANTAHLASIYEVFKSNARAVAAYRPTFLDGDLHIIRAQAEATEMHQDPLLGWKGLAQSVQVYTVPGDHISMFQEPFVSTLAKRIEAIADRLIDSEKSPG